MTSQRGMLRTDAGRTFKNRSGRAPSAARWGLIAAIGLIAPGCDGTATSSSIDIGEDPITGEITYDFDNDGPVVARVRMMAPDQRDFILRATVPVPPGTYVDGDLQVPLAVISSSDQTASVTQVETVTRYPDADDGADVVEVRARVRRPRVEPGTPIEYQVVFSPHDAKTFERAPEVETLLTTPGALRLVSKDPFGNRYESDLLAPLRARSTSVRPVKNGSLVREFAIPSALVPVTVVGGAEGTLPRMMGVTAFVREFANEDFFALDLHVHNAFDGKDPSVDWDAVIRDLYFEDLRLRLPNGWRVMHLADNPCVGTPIGAGPMTEVPLVAALPDGKMHLMHQQSQFLRRLVISKIPSIERAQVELRNQNLAFCMEGTNDSGESLWSWWNPETARFLPQNHQLPSLAGMTTVSSMEEAYSQKLWTIQNQLAAGNEGQYPVTNGNLGWAHPWGIAYGGMTGGDGIDQLPGIDIAWSGSQSAYRYTLLRNRMNLERQPQALIASTGLPTKFQDHVVPTGLNGAYLPFYFSMKQSGSTDYFGFDSTPTFQAEHVVSNGLTPEYEERLREYKPHDLQHLIRYTGDLMTQVWLGNDSLAKLQLLQTSELFRMTHNEVNVGNYGYVGGQSLKKRQETVAEFPGTGIEYGRGEAWGLYASAAAYAFGDDDFRERTRPWMAEVSRVVRAGQSTCTGNITAIRISKHLGGVYRTRQSFEMAFMINALESMRATVFDRVDEDVSERLVETIVDAAYSTISFPFWDPAFGGQRKIIGVGRSDMTTPDFCTNLPADAGYGFHYVDNDTPLVPWAIAYRLTGDAEFLNKAATSWGTTGNLEVELNLLGLDKLKYSGLMLGVSQNMGGNQ